MACFLVPSALAIIVSIIRRALGKAAERVRLGLLEALLWGGAGILALEHVWHGEVVPWPPFLTAMQNPEDWAQALHEMATNGVAMAIATVALWGGILTFEKFVIKAPTRILAEKRVTTTLPAPSK
jgi:hypothetical protein